MTNQDWWRYTIVSRRLTEWLNRHLLALMTTRTINGKSTTEFHTGFLVHHMDLLLWVTAGHVIDRLVEMRENQSIRVDRARWADWRPAFEGAESVPVDFTTLIMLSATSEGVDFGVAVIRGLEADALLRNTNLQIMDERIWKSLDAARPDGYYLIGYPDEWNRIIERTTTGGLERGAAADAACIPIQPIEYRGFDPYNRFWDIPDLFYGQMVPFVDQPEPILQNIVGMSGGPILSLETDVESRIIYRLFGVQRAAYGEYISAEPMRRILPLIGM